MTSLAGWLSLRLLFVIEGSLVALSVIIAFRAPGFGGKWLHRLETALGRFARRRRLAAVSIGVLALLIRAILVPVEPVPIPTIHDEFSFLLAGDTFASGRLANPTHRFWEHFETFQVDSHPTYASMYPPAQGLVLGIGQYLAGLPFLGVWLSVGLMCAAITWMLQGWLPPGWALLGGALVVIRLGSFSYWANSYWGGALGAAAGALVLGSLPRILRRKSNLGLALTLGAGIALLANTRPYEGAVLTLGVAAVLLTAALRRPAGVLLLFRRVAVPTLFVLVPAAALMLDYNAGVFGSPLSLPYTVNRTTYAVAPVFLWQSPRSEPVYRHKSMRDFYVGAELSHFSQVRTKAGFAQFTAQRTEMFWRFFLGPVLSVPLLGVFRGMRDRRVRPLVFVGAVVLIGQSVVAFFAPHYLSPVAGLIWVLVLQGMRHLRQWRYRGNPVGTQLVRMIPAVCLLLFSVRIAFGLAASPKSLQWPFTWATVSTVPIHRHDVITRLMQQPGSHLVFVRYSADHDPFYEYVFNRADIDASRIAWAREMGAVHDRPLIEYMKGRRVWLLEPDAVPWTLRPYPADPTASSVPAPAVLPPAK